MQILDAIRPDLARIVRAGDTVMWGQAGAEPVPLVQSLMAQRKLIGRFRAFIGSTWSEAVKPEHGDCVSFLSYCGAGHNRQLAQAGVLDIWPGHYSELGQNIANGPLKVDVLLLQVAPPDNQGRYSLSMACEYLAPAIRTARAIVVEINEQAPQTCGPFWLNAAQIAYAVNTSREPVSLPRAVPSGVESLIAERVAALIDDGATLQCGIGTLPEQILKKMFDRHDLGFHSGSLGDEAAQLAQAGVITNARKRIDRGVSVAGVLMGSDIVRRYAHRNPALQLRESDYTHSADVLRQIDRFVAINSAIEVDLTGQANTELARGIYIGAVGGALDFLRGAHRSKGGLPIIALPSRVHGKSQISSRIVPVLSGPVSIPRCDAGMIVTEFGVADLRGRTVSERIRCMIDIAHPDDRAQLERHAGMAQKTDGVSVPGAVNIAANMVPKASVSG